MGSFDLADHNRPHNSCLWFLDKKYKFGIMMIPDPSVFVKRGWNSRLQPHQRKKNYSTVSKMKHIHKQVMWGPCGQETVLVSCCVPRKWSQRFTILLPTLPDWVTIGTVEFLQQSGEQEENCVELLMLAWSRSVVSPPTLSWPVYNHEIFVWVMSVVNLEKVGVVNLEKAGVVNLEKVGVVNGSGKEPPFQSE